MHSVCTRAHKHLGHAVKDALGHRGSLRREVVVQAVAQGFLVRCRGVCRLEVSVQVGQAPRSGRLHCATRRERECTGATVQGAC